MQNLIPFSSLPTMAQEIIKHTVMIEGGYVNDPNDSGGATKFGVTEKKARQYGYTGDMRDLPQEFAYAIAAHEFWFGAKMDRVAQISWEVAEEMFDTGYNCGPGSAWKIAQRMLNLMNRQGADWPDIVADGVPGPKTFSALEAAVKRRGALHVFKCFNAGQCAYYIDLAERRPKDEAFFNGWISARVDVTPKVVK